MSSKMVNRKITLFIACTLMVGLIWLGAIAYTTNANVGAQIPIYTPTPGPDGKIIWIVKSNDTLLSISLITGVKVDDIKRLNNLTNDTILVGQKLIIGLAGPALVTPTVGPSPTPTPVLPTPTPKPGSGTLCIILFNDENGDSLRQTSELSIEGGAININNRIGSVSLTSNTISGEKPQCFKDLPEGDYTASVAIPQGYNPTTNNSYSLPLKAGDITYIDFGAQANSQKLAEAPLIPEGGQKSPLLGILGALSLLIGIGVAIFAARLLRSK
jgi:LysM repeat protein